MKPMLIAFLIAIFVLLIISLPFKIKVKFFADAVNLKGFYSIKVAFIKLLCGTAYLEDNNFIMQNTHNIFLQDTKMSTKEKILIKEIIKKISITRAEIYFTGGIESDAYSTAMLCGNIYVLSSALIAYLITNNHFINIYQDVDASFNSDALDVAVSAIVEISILDIIISAIIAHFKYKENNNGKI